MSRAERKSGGRQKRADAKKRRKEIQRRKSLQLEPLEPRLMLFGSRLSPYGLVEIGVPIHEEITSEALDFVSRDKGLLNLGDSIYDKIQKGDISQDESGLLPGDGLDLPYSSSAATYFHFTGNQAKPENHFDGSRFQESAQQINT